MAKKFRPGDRIRNYEIVSLLNQGAMALSYRARETSGRSIFFKQYKSPSVTVPWYSGFVNYQAQIRKRIETTSAARFVYEFIDSFEETWGHRCFFQAFEFVEEGHDLEKTLEKLHAAPASVPWDQRLTFAKVTLAGVHALHDAGIVHCDLKPENIHLIRDETIKAGYRLKLIDMDFSILADVLAPWEGHQNYVGSPNYYSPEHIRGTTPSPASDVFTCGLILYELLANTHPYRSESPEEYTQKVMDYRAAPPKLAGKLPPPASDVDVQSLLHQCLNPDAAARPSAREVNAALNGVTLKATKPGSAPAGDDPRTTRPPAPRPISPITSEAKASEPGTGSRPAPEKTATSKPSAAAALVLVGTDGRTMQFNVRTEIGKHLLRSWGEDAKFADTHQFTLLRGSAGEWSLQPNMGATNQTLVNEEPVLETRVLQPGDEIAVGRVRESQGKPEVVKRLPLRVSFV